MRYPMYEMSPLFTDLYQITMINGYYKTGMHKKNAVFHLYFRKNPFESGYTVAAGLDLVIQYIENMALKPEEKAYLATLTGSDGKPLFDADFLDFFEDMTKNFKCSIAAMPEGTICFPNEPLIRVQGPICQCQLLETAMLNLVNFSTLIATKAARVVHAAKGQDVLEFALRRAQNGMIASRSAFIGGTSSTSNVLAGMTFDIPVKGTHAHSWVMSFDTEQAAFDAYADAMPNNAVLLVDTYNTLKGVEAAIITGQKLRQQGHDLGGIRLDSGDLAWLSKEARRMLDKAGFNKTKIVASNDLDEELIASLKDQGAKIDVWGVGTNLGTGGKQPALGGVYKLAAIQDEDKWYQWTDKIKVSEQTIKTSIPGILDVFRIQTKSGMFVSDVIYGRRHDLTSPHYNKVTFIDPADDTKLSIEKTTYGTRLLKVIFKDGLLKYKSPSLKDIRANTQTGLAKLPDSTKRLLNPHSYKVGIEQKLYNQRKQMILDIRQGRKL
jgi:nicotinate phosphoribosyltransferase